MSQAHRRWNWRVRRRVALGLLTLVAGSIPVVASMAPALAVTATGSMSLDGLLSQTDVETPMSFTASFINDGPDHVDKLKVLVRVSATGLELNGVRLEQHGLDGVWTSVTSKIGSKGDVKFVDDSYKTMAMDVGAALTGRYRVTFLTGTPLGTVVISGEVQHKPAGGSWQTLARSPQYVSEVVGGASGGGAAWFPDASGSASAPASGGPSALAVTDPDTPSPSASGRPSTSRLISPAATVGAVAGASGRGGVLPDGRLDGPGTGTALGRVALSSRITTMAGIGVTVALLLLVAWLLRLQVAGGAGAGGAAAGRGRGRRSAPTGRSGRPGGGRRTGTASR